MRRRAELGGVAAAMTALSVALTWPLALHARNSLPGDLADPLLNCFTLAWDARAMANGLRGLWDAPFFFPARHALAFSDHLLGIAVFTAPVEWVTGNPVLAYNLAFIVSYALAGLGAYLLARTLWASRPAAWVAAVAFAAAPHRAMHISHLQMLTSGWLALSLWGFHEYFASGSRRSLAAGAASFLLLALSSSYLMYFGAVALAVVIVAHLAAAWRRAGPGRSAAPGASPATAPRTPWIRLVTDLALAAVALLLALAPVAAAYLAVRRTTGLRRTVGEMAAFSARPADFLAVPASLRAWSGVLPPGQAERMLFPGLTVVFLAAAAIIAAGVAAARRRDGDGRRWLVALYAGLLGLCAWLMLGPVLSGPYRWLLSILPGFDGLRVPARFSVVASLAIAVLAARGAVVLARGRRLATILPAVFALLIVAEGFAGPLPLVPFDPAQRDRAPLNLWLRWAPPGGLLELPAAGPAFEPFTTTYQFNTLIHRHPIVNGYSGTGYGLQDFLAAPTSPLARIAEVPAGLRGLRAIGVRYLVLHRGLYERWFGWSAQPLVDAVDAQGAQVASRAEFGDTVAWQLANLEPSTAPSGNDLPRVSPRRFAATASPSPLDARFAFDGRLDTRWTTGGPQHGDEWFQVEFDRDLDVGALVFRTDRGGTSERPHHLVVESIGADARARTLFDDSLVPPMIVALAGLSDGIVIPLPENLTRTLRLRQTGRGGRLSWSIFELQIRERLARR